MTASIIQFVCFETHLELPAFMARWAPFASSFLARGIRRIVLAQGAEREHAPEHRHGFRFISRNVWREDRFFDTFRAGMPGDAGVPPVVAVQAGGFRIADSERMDPLARREGVVKVVALVRSDERRAEELASDLSAFARVHTRALGWATYAGVPRARGRFDAVLELHVADADALAALGSITAGLSRDVPRNACSVGLYHEVELLSSGED